MLINQSLLPCETKRYLTLIVMTLLLRGVLGAVQVDKDEVGEILASFLQVTPSVRMAALGGDQVAARGDLGVLFSNPAGLSSLTLPELWVAHHQSSSEGGRIGSDSSA